MHVIHRRCPINVTKIGLLIIFLGVTTLLLRAKDTADAGWPERVPQIEHAQKSPVQDRDEAVRLGQQTFHAHCAQCHGEKAEGSNRAPALTSARVQQEVTEGDLHWFVTNGNKEKGMPAWGPKLADTQIWEVITYVRTLH